MKNDKPNKIKVCAIQLACSDLKKTDKSWLEKEIKRAAKKGAELILLPELHAGPYFCQTEDLDNFDLAETIPGFTSRFLCKLALELGVIIVGSVFEDTNLGIYYNTAIVVDSDGQIAGTYRKTHIPDDPGYFEKYYFTPGDSNLHPIQTSIGKLGIMICWDQWFPEAARLMTLAGADILLYASAIGWDLNDDSHTQKLQKNAWITIQQSHAIANAVPVVCSNRVGFEADHSGQTKGIKFWGASFICNQEGEVVTEASTQEAEIIISDIDLNETIKQRKIWPFLRDRRVDCYKDLKLRMRIQD